MITKKGNTITFDPEIEWPKHRSRGAMILSLKKLHDGMYVAQYRAAASLTPHTVRTFQTSGKFSNWDSLNEIWKRAIESVTNLEAPNSYIQDAQF